jgi:hypothetical protein
MEEAARHPSKMSHFPLISKDFYALRRILYPICDAFAIVRPTEGLMKFQKRGRTGTKLQMKCHKCRGECPPKDGDWHDSKEGQIFLCKPCGPSGQVGESRPKLHYSSIFAQPTRA